MKGGTILEKITILKDKGLNLRAEPPRIKLYWVPASHVPKHARTHVPVPLSATAEDIFQARGLVSKETVVLRRWGRETQKFVFSNWVDKVNWPP